MRVVHPGVLGQPGRVLLPLAGRPGSEADAIPVLALLGTALGHLHVLFVRELSRLRAVEPGRDAQARLLAAGRAFVARVEAEARAALAPHRFELDASVVLGRDVAREILVAAARHRTRLVCLGASKRTLPERLVHGNSIERVLRETTADVAVYRSARA